MSSMYWAHWTAFMNRSKCFLRKLDREELFYWVHVPVSYRQTSCCRNWRPASRWTVGPPFGDSCMPLRTQAYRKISSRPCVVQRPSGSDWMNIFYCNHLRWDCKFFRYWRSRWASSARKLVLRFLKIAVLLWCHIYVVVPTRQNVHFHVDCSGQALAVGRWVVLRSWFVYELFVHSNDKSMTGETVMKFYQKRFNTLLLLLHWAIPVKLLINFRRDSSLSFGLRFLSLVSYAVPWEFFVVLACGTLHLLVSPMSETNIVRNGRCFESVSFEQTNNGVDCFFFIFDEQMPSGNRVHWFHVINLLRCHDWEIRNVQALFQFVRLIREIVDWYSLFLLLRWLLRQKGYITFVI